MELNNSFTVDVGIDRAWQVLTDVPAIAPCLPGAQLQEVEDEEYRGIVKVKVGPIVAQYKGKATFVESNVSDHRIVLRAEGRETRGQGNASALITAQLTEEGDRTRVVVDTDLTITGKVAQFGRGVMADVSGKLMDQFAENLARTVLEPAALDDASTEGEERSSGNGSEPDSPAPAAKPPVGAGPEPEPIDLLGTAGAPAAQRLLPPIIAAVLALLVIRSVIRRRRR